MLPYDIFTQDGAGVVLAPRMGKARVTGRRKATGLSRVGWAAERRRAMKIKSKVKAGSYYSDGG